MNWDYVGGFFDGEGSAFLSAHRREDCKSHYHFRPNLKITQRRNRAILQAIRDFLGVGWIGSSGRNGESEQWSIVGAKQCLMIIPELRAHVILKARPLELLEEACHIVAKRNGYSPQSTVVRLLQIRKELQGLNSKKSHTQRNPY